MIMMIKSRLLNFFSDLLCLTLQVLNVTMDLEEQLKMEILQKLQREGSTVTAAEIDLSEDYTSGIESRYDTRTEFFSRHCVQCLYPFFQCQHKNRHSTSFC